MRVAVMAAGAVGGYFGARLAAAGHPVAFIARGAHGEAMRRDGLLIESPLGDLHLGKVDVTDDPKEVGPVDLVLFAVKLWDTESAGEETRPLIGPPGMPAPIVAALRKAMAEAVKDKAFLADAAKIGLDIDPMSGEETEQAFARFYRTPPAVVKRAISIMGRK